MIKFPYIKPTRVKTEAESKKTKVRNIYFFREIRMLRLFNNNYRGREQNSTYARARSHNIERELSAQIKI